MLVHEGKSTDCYASGSLGYHCQIVMHITVHRTEFVCYMLFLLSHRPKTGLCKRSNHICSNLKETNLTLNSSEVVWTALCTYGLDAHSKKISKFVRSEQQVVNKISWSLHSTHTDTHRHTHTLTITWQEQWDQLNHFFWSTKDKSVPLSSYSDQSDFFFFFTENLKNLQALFDPIAHSQSVT